MSSLQSGSWIKPTAGLRISKAYSGNFTSEKDVIKVATRDKKIIMKPKYWWSHFKHRYSKSLGLQWITGLPPKWIQNYKILKNLKLLLKCEMAEFLCISIESSADFVTIYRLEGGDTQFEFDNLTLWCYDLPHKTIIVSFTDKLNRSSRALLHESIKRTDSKERNVIRTKLWKVRHTLLFFQLMLKKTHF